MRVTLSARDLKTMLNAVNVLVSEARVQFTKQGLQIRAVDPSNVAMVIVNAGVEIFEKYEIENEVLIGVDVGKLANVSKSLDSRLLTELTVADKMLTLSSSNMVYSIALLDPEAIRKEPPVPNIRLVAEVVVDPNEFKKAISIIEHVDLDEMLFEKDTEFRIAGEGDPESVAYRLGLIEANEGKAKARYSLEYLKDFCEIASDTNLLKIKFDTDKVCWLTFEIRTGLNVEYILAPRVERRLK